MVHNYKEIFYVNDRHHYIKTYTDHDKQLVHYKNLNKDMISIGDIKTLKLADFKKFLKRNKYSFTNVKATEYDVTCRKCKTEFKTQFPEKEFCDQCYKKANEEIMQEINEKLGSLLK